VPKHNPPLNYERCFHRVHNSILKPRIERKTKHKCLQPAQLMLQVIYNRQQFHEAH